MHRTPQGHTLIVLAVAVGGLGVLLVYAITRQTAPGGILTMITAVATGPAATCLTGRADRGGRRAAGGDAGRAAAGGDPWPPGGGGQDDSGAPGSGSSTEDEE